MSGGGEKERKRKKRECPLFKLIKMGIRSKDDNDVDHCSLCSARWPAETKRQTGPTKGCSDRHRERDEAQETNYGVSE